MIYELRTYDLRVGSAGEYLELFARRAYPLLSEFAEPVGFWSCGTVGTGRVERVNHVWAYESLSAREERRKAMYADARWTGDVSPAVFSFLTRMDGRLMSLDERTYVDLRAAQAGTRGSPVVARTVPAGCREEGRPFARFRFLTGRVGERLELDWLEEASFEQAPEGAVQDIWSPAPFSRIR